MLELLRDPAWQSIGAILALLGIVAVFWVYWLQRQTKELAFGLISSHRLVSVADELSSRVSIQLDGKPVKNLHLLVYGLKNSGHRAIAVSDFVRPLSISFADGQVISAEVTSQTPLNLGTKLVVTETSIELQPLLLNASDQILIQALISAPNLSASVDTRILDIPAIEPVNVSPRFPPFFKSGLPFMIGLFLLWAAGTYIINKNASESMVFLGGAVFVALLGLGAQIYQRTGLSARRYISEP